MNIESILYDKPEELNVYRRSHPTERLSLQNIVLAESKDLEEVNLGFLEISNLTTPAISLKGSSFLSLIHI